MEDWEAVTILDKNVTPSSRKMVIVVKNDGRWEILFFGCTDEEMKGRIRWWQLVLKQFSWWCCWWWLRVVVVVKWKGDSGWRRGDNKGLLLTLSVDKRGSIVLSSRTDVEKDRSFLKLKVCVCTGYTNLHFVVNVWWPQEKELMVFRSFCCCFSINNVSLNLQCPVCFCDIGKVLCPLFF